MKAEVDERVLGGCGDDEDRAAAAAVAAVRAAARDELFAPEAQAAAAAGARLNVNVDFVDEHQSMQVNAQLQGPVPKRPSHWELAWELGFRPLLDRDDANPSAVLAVVFEADLAVDLGEERVVLAEPDVEPGSNRRPFWRTRMEPPVTTLPS